MENVNETGLYMGRNRRAKRFLVMADEESSSSIHLGEEIFADSVIPKEERFSESIRNESFRPSRSTSNNLSTSGQLDELIESLAPFSNFSDSQIISGAMAIPPPPPVLRSTGDDETSTPILSSRASSSYRTEESNLEKHDVRMSEGLSIHSSRRSYRNSRASSTVIPPVLQPKIEFHWEGYLLKRSQWLMNWKLFYFVLDGRSLKCYTSHEESLRFPENSRIKDGKFSFASTFLIGRSINVPTTGTLDLTSNPLGDTAVLPASTEYVEKSSPGGSTNSTGVSYRFDLELVRSKYRLHLMAPNEATKQVWMHLASDGVTATDSLGKRLNSSHGLSIGIDQFYATYRFFLESLCEINDHLTADTGGGTANGDSSGRRAFLSSILGTGIAMPGATIVPPIDYAIARMTSMLHPSVVLKSNYLPMVPFSGTFNGPYGILEYFTTLAHAMHFKSFRVTDMSMDDNARLAVVAGVETFQVRLSRRPFTQNWVHKLHFTSSGLVTRIEVLGDAVASSVVFKPKGFAASLSLPNNNSAITKKLTLVVQSIDGLKMANGDVLKIRVEIGGRIYDSKSVQGDSSKFDYRIRLPENGDIDSFTLSLLNDDAVVIGKTDSISVSTLQVGKPQGFKVTSGSGTIGTVTIYTKAQGENSKSASSTDRTISDSTAIINSSCEVESPVIKSDEWQSIVVSNTLFKIESKYELVKVVGKGAYGVVIAVADVEDGETYAMKKISGFMRHPKLGALTLREIMLMKLLGNHPSLMNIRDLPCDSTNCDDFKDLYIVQPLMETDLCRVIHSKEVLEERHILVEATYIN